MSAPTTSVKTAVLLLAHGSPDHADDVPEFLRYVTNGRSLPPALVEEVQRRYALIGRSPLTEITLRQASGVERELRLPVYVGMRNWRPFIKDAVQKMASDGIRRAVVVCLTPHNSRTSVGLYRRTLEDADPSFEIDFVDSWHDHPLLVRAFTQKLQAAWQRVCTEAGARVPIIFTAHSVPERTITEGDPYAEQARQTAELVAMEVPALIPDDWRFAFQSQGAAGGPWLGPTVEDTILELTRIGHRAVLVQPVGFVCDHVEVLYDIDIAFQRFANERGMRLWRTESLNDSPLFIAAVAEVARSRLLPAGEPRPQVVQIKI